MDYQARQERLKQSLEEKEVEALIVVKLANQRYLTGFTGEGLLLAGEDARLATDGRFFAEAAAAAVEDSVFHNKGHWAGIASLIREGGYSRVGFEAQHTTVAALEDLEKEVEGVELVPLRRVVEPLRLRKSPEEVELIRQAAAIADRAYERFLASGPPAQSEKLAALDLLRLMLEAGADDKAFDTILACGPGAAEPHHVPGERVLEAPAPLKIDMGAKVAGYCSDMTRTIYLGQPDDTFRRVYRAVYEAQEAALAQVRAGARGKDVDAAARRVLEEAGYGEQFSHGLGHGVGLEVHEGPSLGSTSEDVLEEGHVVTIEPGVYLEGWGGVRIEDLVLVTSDGCERLTRAAKLSPDEL